MEIRDGRAWMSEVRALIGEYTRALGRDLTFQNLEEELQHPEEKYAPPHGELLVAVHEDMVVGMVAYHRHSAVRCEMKRLYIMPSMRGQHVGEALVETIIRRATQAGYEEMVLDTLEGMNAARHLYDKFGFELCEAYYHNPMPDVLYMRKSLQSPCPSQACREN